VIAVDANREQATIKHEEIQGLMPAMTMPYKTKVPQVLEGIKPGDLINAKLVVGPNDAYLTEVNKVGEAPLASTDAAVQTPPAAAKSLQPGDTVADGHFIDQEGHRRNFSSFRGSPVVLTFMYTRCPIPDFCPLMDHHFVDIQGAANADVSLKKLQLVSISFDPITDTPPVLKKHAQELSANPTRWTFLTGTASEIDGFAGQFGVTITRAKDNPLDITHTLRTAIVDSSGKVVKVYVGNDWTPAQVITDLKNALARPVQPA
jgi:protein SCO1/2